MHTPSLFVRDPVTLDGYVPKFDRNEVKLDYKCEEITIGRGPGGPGGVWDDDDDPFRSTRKETQRSITVDGQKIIGRPLYFIPKSDLQIVIAIAKQVLDGGEPKFVDARAYKWLKENFNDLVNSIRYWEAVSRLEGIRKVEKEIAELQKRVRIGKILANVDAVQVKAEKAFSVGEFQICCLEFGMLEEEYKHYVQS